MKDVIKAKIARIWSGTVKRELADEYEEFLNKKAVPDYHSIKGNLGVIILRRDEKETTEFLIITFWDDIMSIKKFAGEEYEKAKYYPEDIKYLIRFEPKVKHYRITYKD